MSEETFETPQPQPEADRPLDDGQNWPKIILVAVLGLGLLAGAAYTGYWYGTQQVQQSEESTPHRLPTNNKTDSNSRTNTLTDSRR